MAPKDFPIILHKALHLGHILLVTLPVTNSEQDLAKRVGFRQLPACCAACCCSCSETGEMCATLVRRNTQRLHLYYPHYQWPSSGHQANLNSCCLLARVAMSKATPEGWSLACASTQAELQEITCGVLDDQCQGSSKDHSGISAVGDLTSLPWHTDSVVQAKSPGF